MHVSVIICNGLISGVVMMKVKRHLYRSSATPGPVTVMEEQVQQEFCGDLIQMFIRHAGTFLNNRHSKCICSQFYS